MVSQLPLRLVASLFAVLLFPSATAVPLAAASEASEAGARCGPSWTVAPSPDPAGPVALLRGVDAAGPDDAWAVGQGLVSEGYRALIERWDGSSWRVVPTPRPPEGSDDSLEAVAAIDREDAWAVGGRSGTVFEALILHWDGTSWKVVDGPRLDSMGTVSLYGIDAVSSTDVWAVGSFYDQTGERVLIQHYDGTRWQVDRRLDRIAGRLTGVDARSADDAWAVGPAGLTMHWNGHRWSEIANANDRARLFDVGVLGRRDAAAVGFSFDGDASTSLIERWNGSTWKTVEHAAARSKSSVGLRSIAVASDRDIWAAGAYFKENDVVSSLIEHWDGESWDVVSSPELRHSGSGVTNEANELEDVAVLSSGRAWVVGSYRLGGRYRPMIGQLCPVRVLDEGFGVQRAEVSIGETAVWKFAPVNTLQHAVADDTGLGLFDSGLRPPGSSFTFRFFSAGTYRFSDRTTGARASIAVPVRVSLRDGSVFLRWASTRAPTGFLYDVQVSRPGDSAFSYWRTGVVANEAAFEATSGEGTYLFRARLRRGVNDATSAWSPAVSVEVGS